MSIYYADEWVTLHHADNRDILPGLADQSIDLVLTDPPYDEEVHQNSKRRYGTQAQPVSRKVIDFLPLSTIAMVRYFETFARLSQGWTISFLSSRHASRLEKKPPVGLSFVRKGIWFKPNTAPHINQDRPSQGYETIAMLHRDRPGKYLWHGRAMGRNHSVFVYPINGDGVHSTGKPLPLLCKLIALFSNPGDLILDPFGGAGSTAVAAKRLGRRCIIIEQDERYCEIAARRLSQDCMQLEAAGPAVAGAC